MDVQASLLLSALRAFLGRIHPAMRVVKAKFVGELIQVTILLESAPSECIREDVSEAAAEIIADFPAPYQIAELLKVVDGPLPREDVVSEGWIYQRAE